MIMLQDYVYKGRKHSLPHTFSEFECYSFLLFRLLSLSIENRYYHVYHTYFDLNLLFSNERD